MLGLPFSPLLLALLLPAMSFRLNRSLLSRSFAATAAGKDFGRGFSCPVPRAEDLVLSQVHRHELDEHVSFDGDKHVYSYKGEPVRLSVTSLIKHYFPSFEPRAIAEGMMRGSNWPRAGYIHADGTAYTLEEIVGKWEDIGIYARNRGQWLHHNIEMLLNGQQTVTAAEVPEWEQVLSFRRSYLQAQGIEPYRTEWRIVHPTLSLGGSIDFLGKQGERFVLLDWKRTKRIRASGGDSSEVSGVPVSCCGVDSPQTRRFKKKFGAPPLQHLEDSDLNRYALQLSMYAHILRSSYGLEVGADMALVVFNPDAADYVLQPVPDMREEVQWITEDLARRMQDEAPG